MKRFKCTVTRVDEYEIEFDENIFNNDFMEHYKKYFRDFESLEEHAEHIAQFRARFGERFIEGYGYPLVNNKVPFVAKFEKNEKDVNHGLNIKILDEDNNCYVEVEEIE